MNRKTFDSKKPSPSDVDLPVCVAIRRQENLPITPWHAKGKLPADHGDATEMYELDVGLLKKSIDQAASGNVERKPIHLEGCYRPPESTSTSRWIRFPTLLLPVETQPLTLILHTRQRDHLGGADSTMDESAPSAPMVDTSELERFRLSH